MKESKTLLLIDGHALAFRQYYALERTQMKTKDGIPSWGVYGFFKAIFDLLKNKNFSFDSIGVAFDVSHHTFRTESYTEYKANRVAMPDDMQIQMGLIYEGLNSFSIPIYTKEGYEADDVIGTISKKACELGHKVYILTGDQDSFQLIDKDGCVKVIIPSQGVLKEYDWDAVYKKLGVYPNQVIDYKALRGDVSDNIPGIRGIGEKTAVKLLSQFGTVDNVLANIDSIDGNSIKQKIKDGVEDAKLSKFLATIVKDVDVDFDFEKTCINLPNLVSVTDFFRKMQFYSFLKNIDSILKNFDKNNCVQNSETQIILEPEKESENNENGIQLGLFAQSVQKKINKKSFDYVSKLITDSTDFELLIEKLKSSSVITFRFYGKIINAVEFEIYGICIGLNEGFSYNDKIVYSENEKQTVSYYIPIHHNIENCLKINFVLDSLKPVLENENIKKITHNLKSCLNILKNFGINLSGAVFDTELASYIKDSNAQNDFDIQCMERINHILPTMVSENKKAEFYEYDIESVKNYTAESTTALFELTKYWINHLDLKEFDILENIEIPLSYVLSDMEFNGVSVDVEYLNELTKDFDILINKTENRIYELAQESFNLNSPKQVAQILFEKLQLKSPKKGKSKNSTSAEILTALAQDHEIARLILEYRKYSKLKSTYTESLPLLINKKDNRIHTTYNQTNTATGRLSSSNPNLQNIPTRTIEGNKIRKAFVPSDKNNLIISADYSQIELRLLAHVSEDKHLIEAFKSGEDIHTVTASKVFGVDISEVTKDMRYKSKAVNFGIIYGQTKYGLAKALKINPAQAQKFIDKYFETYPKIKIYMEKMVNFVEEKGYAQTFTGRKRYLNSEINSSNAMIREFAKRAAINHPMQGAAADLIKMAMIDFEKKLKENNLKSKLIIQVHDELVVETEKSESELVKKLILEAMELGQPLKVPLVIDINEGKTWQEL